MLYPKPSGLLQCLQVFASPHGGHCDCGLPVGYHGESAVGDGSRRNSAERNGHVSSSSSSSSSGGGAGGGRSDMSRSSSGHDVSSSSYNPDNNTASSTSPTSSSSSSSSSSAATQRPRPCHTVHDLTIGTHDR